MNFLRKALTSDTKPKASHGDKFTNRERDYYELARMLRKLLKDVKRYTALWGELLACKTSIYGYLLYFYNKKSEKRTLIDDLFKFHTRPMDKDVNKLTLEYEHNLIDEIEQILKIFPQTQKLSASLSLKKQQYLAKKQYYQQLKQANGKNIDYSELAEVDEERRILQHAYEFSVTRVISEFEEKVNHKDSILDRFCIRMFESDAKLYSNLFKTSRILREKALIFQYYRQYPQGLPSYFRDYSYRQDIQSSSDSDINAPPSNIFYQNTNNNNTANENDNDELKNNIQPKQPKQPKDVYDINQTPKRGKTKPPPPQYKKPKAPTKSTQPLPKQNVHNLHVNISNNVDINNNNDIDSNTKPIIPNANTNKANNANKIRTLSRVRSKSVSSPPVHRTPPPPPPTRLPGLKRRRSTVDFAAKPKKYSMDASDTSNSSSISPALPSSNTAMTQLSLDSEDSLHRHNDANQDEWQMASPDALILNKKLPPKKKKTPTANKHSEIVQLLKKDNRVQPWVWNKTNYGEEASYGYCRPTDKKEDDNEHPLGVGMHTMLNFRHMHQLFHPKQIRHIGDPNSSVIPNRIHINDIVVRSVNVRKLTLDTNKLDPAVQSMIYSSRKQKSKHIIENIPKPMSTKTINAPPVKSPKSMYRPNAPTPTPPTPPPPPPPKSNNDGNAKHTSNI